MKSVAPKSLQVRVKDGQVFTEGSWRKIQIRKTSEMALQLRKNPRWQRALPPAAPERLKETVVPKPTIDLSEPLKRQDLERLIGKSRSATNRLILEWLRKGLATRVGDARSTRYRLNRNLRTELSKVNSLEAES